MSTSPVARVFVIVVTYNGQKWIDKCFGSLRGSSYPVNVIVVDNNSTDQTVSLLKNNYPENEVIVNTYNAGFGKANNQGISRALAMGADYIFLLNQDAWIVGNAIGTLVAAGQEQPSFGVLSPLHYAKENGPLDRNFEYYLRKDHPHTKAFNSTDDVPNVLRVAFVNAAAWMVSKRCLEVVGGFGDLFFHYGEDRDYTQRAHYFGIKTGVVSTASIVHDRIERGDEKKQQRSEKLERYYYVGSLARLTDPKKSLASAFGSVLMWNSKELVQHIFKGNARNLGLYFRVIAKCVGQISSIQQYRGRITQHSPYRFL